MTVLPAILQAHSFSDSGTAKSSTHRSITFSIICHEVSGSVIVGEVLDSLTSRYRSAGLRHNLEERSNVLGDILRQEIPPPLSTRC